MRPTRRFRPSVDCLQARIALSGVTGAAGAAASAATPPTTPVVAAADETGSPGSEPTGYESYEYIMTPTVATTPGSTNLC